MQTSTLVTAIASGTERRLRRVLGLGALLAVAVGLVVSQGVMVMMLQGAGYAGLGFILPLSLAYLLALSYACSFSELALMVPRAGGLSSYTEVALGHFPAILATFSGYVVVAMFALSAELLLLDLIVDKLYPGVFPPMSVAFGVLALFTLLNLVGIDIFARLQIAMSVVMVIVLLILGVAAIVSGSSQGQLSSVAAGGWNPMGAGVLTLTAMAVWGFVGAEFVCPLVEETKKPERNIPRAMLIGLTVIFATIGLYCLGALFLLPAETLRSDALPHYLFATTMFGKSGEIFLVIAAVTATCSTLNTSLAAIPRMLYGMACNGQAFPAFKRLSTRTRTPWVAVLFVAAITGLPIALMGQNAAAINLLLAAALAWLLAYIIVHLDVIALRFRYPHAVRPFRTPFYPLPQLFGIAGMVYAIWHAAPTPESAGQIFGIAGAVLAVVSLIAIAWIKWVMRKPLLVPEPLQTTHPNG
ncbi:APC family permease [Pseudomonas sp.]|uniref:APC family permease n=1 Tax=Pseudomonas sp. TaxID=306 RepID=UPI00289C9467|nr:APC family permease [Pseudomonas sp.]